MSRVSYPNSEEVGGTGTIGSPANVGGTPLLRAGLTAVGSGNRGGASRRGALSLLSPSTSRPSSSAPTGAGENFHTGAQRWAFYRSFHPRETSDGESDEAPTKHASVNSKVVAAKTLYTNIASRRDVSREDKDCSHEFDYSSADDDRRLRRASRRDGSPLSFEDIRRRGSGGRDEGAPGKSVSKRDRATRRYRGDDEPADTDNDRRRGTSSECREREHSYESSKTGMRRQNSKSRQTEADRVDDESRARKSGDKSSKSISDAISKRPSDEVIHDDDNYYKRSKYVSKIESDDSSSDDEDWHRRRSRKPKQAQWSNQAVVDSRGSLRRKEQWRREYSGSETDVDVKDRARNKLRQEAERRHREGSREHMHSKRRSVHSSNTDGNKDNCRERLTGRRRRSNYLNESDSSDNDCSEHPRCRSQKWR